jgi:hypothetical protein
VDSANDLKNIPDPGFAGDDGAADPAVTAALAGYAADPATEPELLRVLRRSRLMVPIVAVLGEVEYDEHGHKHEKTSDMAVPVLQAPDGRRALPAFTSLAAMFAWRPDARPAPVAAPQAALTAYSEQADTLLIDPAGPVAYQLTGAPLRALAENRDWLPPVEDPEVRAALTALLAAEPRVLRAELRPGKETDAVLALALEDGAPVAEVAQRVAGGVTADPVLQVRLARGLDLALLPATASGSGFYRREG